MPRPGDKVPFCYGVAADRTFYSFDQQSGRPAVLVLCGATDMGALHPLLDALAARLPQIAARQADVVLLISGNPGLIHTARGGAPEGLHVVDCASRFFVDCGATAQPLVLVIDRAARLVWRHAATEQDPDQLVVATLEALATISHEPAHDCVLPAPVLQIPNLLDGTLCRTLIERFETGATFDSGVTGADADARPRDHIDHAKKRRRDCLLEPGESLHDEVLDLLLRRCAPEIRKAFHHVVSHIDRMLIARYDDTGGYFHRHRDNAAQSVAFRQFAISVNLNTGEYDGGDLLFPEFNDHRHAPPAGGGLVFSASLLHAATAVTRGRRYVLLTFLHDADAEARRTAHLGSTRVVGELLTGAAA